MEEPPLTQAQQPMDTLAPEQQPKASHQPFPSSQSSGKSTHLSSHPFLSCIVSPPPLLAPRSPISSHHAKSARSRVH